MADLGAIGRPGSSAKVSPSIISFPLTMAARSRGTPPASYSRSGFMSVLSPILGVGDRDGTISLTETISGTVRDDNGILAVRKLRAYERASGRFIGEVWSGANGQYSLRVFSHVEHDVICFDDPANTAYNDQILRVAPAP